MPNNKGFIVFGLVRFTRVFLFLLFRLVLLVPWLNLLSWNKKNQTEHTEETYRIV